MSQRRRYQPLTLIRAVTPELEPEPEPEAEAEPGSPESPVLRYRRVPRSTIQEEEWQQLERFGVYLRQLQQEEEKIQFHSLIDFPTLLPNNRIYTMGLSDGRSWPYVLAGYPRVMRQDVLLDMTFTRTQMNASLFRSSVETERLDPTLEALWRGSVYCRRIPRNPFRAFNPQQQVGDRLWVLWDAQRQKWDIVVAENFQLLHLDTNNLTLAQVQQITHEVTAPLGAHTQDVAVRLAEVGYRHAEFLRSGEDTLLVPYPRYRNGATIRASTRELCEEVPEGSAGFPIEIDED